jgi:uracil-DNA glycosylase family 4
MKATKVGAGAAAARLRALRDAMLGCERCAALVKCRAQVVPGHGAAPATVAFVGLAPGRLGGDRTGVPFSGDRSGTLLRLMIARTGLESVFITNVVRCNPRDARGRNRDPRPREIANCRDHLAAELEIVRPRIVVCLGTVAWRELAGDQAPFRPRRPGAISSGGGVLLYPMYHPAYVVRGAYSRRAYARDFMRLARLLRALAEPRRRTHASLAERFSAPIQPCTEPGARTDVGMIF